jgi:hypothetical protein
MRNSGFFAAACALLCAAQASLALASSMAPADEYFGRHRISILEIRNRLNDLDRRRDWEMRGQVRQLDDLEDAELDWQHKYPRDPWLPSFLARLLRDYHRANAQSDPRAQIAFRVLRYDYTRAPETRSIVALYVPAHRSAKAAVACHRTLFHRKC